MINAVIDPVNCLNKKYLCQNGMIVTLRENSRKHWGERNQYRYIVQNVYTHFGNQNTRFDEYGRSTPSGNNIIEEFKGAD